MKYIYIYIYISTRNGRIQNGWTGPVFRHYRGQAVWIQSGNKLKKGTVVALTNKPQSCTARETTDKLIGLPSQVVPYPKPEETV